MVKAQSNNNTVTVLDIGSAKTIALIAEVTDSGLRYRGHGIAESRGSRKGIIVELDKAAESIQKAVEEAEKAAGCAVGNAVIAIGGAHVKGVTSRGGVSLGVKPREVGRDDIRMAVEKAVTIKGMVLNNVHTGEKKSAVFVYALDGPPPIKTELERIMRADSPRSDR